MVEKVDGLSDKVLSGGDLDRIMLRSERRKVVQSRCEDEYDKFMGGRMMRFDFENYWDRRKIGDPVIFVGGEAYFGMINFVSIVLFNFQIGIYW